MPCTTLLVGKKASYNGSTIMARNEDSKSGEFTPKKFIVVNPKDQPRHYKSVLSKFELDLPDNPVRYTAVPNANPKEGIWGEAGVNEYNVSMSETETITSNSRVLGADPLVKDGIGEEDMLTIVLPYIKTAREGVERLGALIEKYGTYEMNGIGFQDENEIWWFESIGGHHFIAKRVPDDSYVVMPNQQGIDDFDFEDAFGKKENHICSKDLISFILDNYLDLSNDNLEMFEDASLSKRQFFDVRAAFGSHDDSDHIYNTPRAWFMARYLNPTTYVWDGPMADYRPESDNIPWSFVPEHKITIEDVKYALSGYYQGTPFNPYVKGDDRFKNKFRPIGINRNNFISITEIRPNKPKAIKALQWLGMGSNAFNAVVPFYTQITDTPDYLKNTTDTVTTNNFYWASRIIGALADAHFNTTAIHIERYQDQVSRLSHNMIKTYDKKYEDNPNDSVMMNANLDIAKMVEEETNKVLDKVLYTASMGMKNAFARSDA